MSAKGSDEVNNIGQTKYLYRFFKVAFGGKLTPEEELEFQLKKSENECQRCEKYKKYMLSYSPTVRFMLDNIHKLGGNLHEDNILCAHCTERRGGGFSPELGIVLCENYIADKSHLEDVLSHELVHAYDFCKFNIDWMNLKHVACSEIRASNLSGECRMMNELIKNRLITQLKFVKQQQECVKRRALISIKSHPSCKSEEMAERVLDQVWNSCFRDTRPFDELYR
ncbi:hypothetical protein CANCADRAFT_147498 [Tortispora caseinolytica NRRL Y-17796]|uniref:Mitochondrial inner membrane protease ATP23 n=1 Tax=Tortispora caseinolytica NRRL Y-17796 TaxID=767744 RepID=A0A1E4TK25_9ASCO|nr:hypothetical protein CANCADRAFT_147498 [Tortispora caseinolytica NRRL Y-17796]